MAMFHHGNQNYNEAASEAAATGRVKMQELIHKGQASALRVIEQVQNQVPIDAVVRARAIGFKHEENALRMYVPELNAGNALALHKNALQQVASKTGIGMQALDHFTSQGEWGHDLAAHTLNQFFQHSNERHLLRSVNGEVRGILSDKYRRLDSRPLLEAFVSACKEIGALPIEGYALETKIHLRVVLPVIFEPLANEIQLFGLDWHNSDFGNGAHGISLWNMRVWCTNKAMMEELLRQVHLGARLSDDVTYSTQTMQLDTKTNASALRDIVRHELSPARINGYLDAVRNLADQKLTGEQARNFLKAAKLGKGDTDAVIEAYNSPDVEMLPAGNSVYRMTQAISWIANQTEDADKSLDLQATAGKLIRHHAGMNK